MCGCAIAKLELRRRVEALDNEDGAFVFAHACKLGLFWGQKHALLRRSIAVRFTPISRPRQDGLNAALCATTGLRQCSKRHLRPR
jgi:hypothetical protein